MLLNILCLTLLGHLSLAGARPSSPDVHANSGRALAPAQPPLYACANSLTVDGKVYTLQETSSASQYFWCTYYRFREFDSVKYCWYDVSNVVFLFG